MFAITTSMQIHRIVVPALAVGSMLATLSLASLAWYRRDRSMQRAPVRKPLTPARRRIAEPTQPMPRDVVLPLAFWDAAADLDPEDDLPLAAHALGLSEEPYDSMDLEDASATWLSRATQTPLHGFRDDVDDPAEIAADSMSMVSEASRAAAADPSVSEDASEDPASVADWESRGTRARVLERRGRS